MHNIVADVHGPEKRKKEITYEGNKCTQLVEEEEEEEEATRAVSHLGREEQAATLLS